LVIINKIVFYYINSNKYYFILSKLIKSNLEIGNNLKNDWNKKQLSFLINDCTKIEENINKVKIINNKINKYISANS